MIVDLTTQLDRLVELSRLHLEMCQEFGNIRSNRFWELSKKLDEVTAINKIEDEINKEYDPDDPGHERDIKERG